MIKPVDQLSQWYPFLPIHLVSMNENTVFKNGFTIILSLVLGIMIRQLFANFDQATTSQIIRKI